MVTYPDETWDPVTKMNHALYDGTLLRIFDDRFSAILCNTQMEMVRAGGGGARRASSGHVSDEATPKRRGGEEHSGEDGGDG